MAMNRKAGTDVESLTRLPAITASAIIARGLKAARDGIECVACHCKTSEEQAKSNKASWLKDWFSGVSAHVSLLSSKISSLGDFVND